MQPFVSFRADNLLLTSTYVRARCLCSLGEAWVDRSIEIFRLALCSSSEGYAHDIPGNAASGLFYDNGVENDDGVAVILLFLSRFISLHVFWFE